MRIATIPLPIFPNSYMLGRICCKNIGETAWAEICGRNSALTSRINEIPNGGTVESTRAQNCAVVKIL